MKYLEPVYRPPSEADSLILQVTYGCTHNECTFCGMYQQKKFRTRSFEDICLDLDEAGEWAWDTRRIFLADGDAMVLSPAKLSRILEELNRRFRHLERVGIYSDSRGILMKSDEDLRALRKQKLGIIYLGLESGSDSVLSAIQKGATAEDMTRAIQKANQAGFETSVIALLGIGGKAFSSEHARATAKVVSQMAPTYFSALTLTLVPGTPLADQAARGDFIQLTPEESLQELKQMILEIDSSSPIIFRTNHASNYVPLKGELPGDRTQLVEIIDRALKEGRLKPEWLRGL